MQNEVVSSSIVLGSRSSTMSETRVAALDAAHRPRLAQVERQDPRDHPGQSLVPRLVEPVRRLSSSVRRTASVCSSSLRVT